jgi:hypothetical protein
MKLDLTLALCVCLYLMLGKFVLLLVVFVGLVAVALYRVNRPESIV